MSDDTGNWPKWLSGALNIVSGTLQAAAGAALGATVGWTGIGAVVAGFLVVNGAATVTQGIGQVVNSITQSNSMREDNIIRTGVQHIGGAIGGDTGRAVAGALYDVAVVAAASSVPNITASSAIPTTTPVSGACFVAGTAILTSTGLEAIEDICAGDLVWSENPDTGERSIKEVVQVFVRETYELIHIFVNGEEIITTPEHPFFVYGLGWTPAEKLNRGNILTLQNGDFAIIKEVQYEHLKSPTIVYNFEVADFHTYYVGANSVLVHNMCRPQSPVKLKENALKGVDAHAFKRDFVGSNVARWDIYKDTANNSILWLGNKAQTVWLKTEYFLKDLLELFPK